MRFLVALALVAGCTPFVSPPEPAPHPGPYAPADCSGACATTELLKCPWYEPTCVSDCTRANTMLAKIHSAQLNTPCLHAATTCDESWACRGENP